MNKYLARYLFYYPVTFMKGEFVSRYLKIYESFQWQSRHDIELHQLRTLRTLLVHAYEHVAHYRKSFDEAGVQPRDVRTLDDIELLPFLEKEQLRTKYAYLIARPTRLRLFQKTTGGSTGEAVTLLKDTHALARERAATWRGYAWASVGVADPQARFWGIPIAKKNALLARLADFAANRKRLSAFGIDEGVLQHYYETIVNFKPSYFYGYVSVLLEFARFVAQKSYIMPSTLRSIITTSEVLDDNSRQYLQSAFRCKVYNEYGCGEVGSIAHECEHGNMHIMADNLIVEILADPGAVDDGVGEVVVTDLFNFAMPLIRYKLKDYAALSQDRCQCGRELPLIRKVYGRAYDMVTDKKGKKYHPEILLYIFERFKDKYGTIKQFQVIQKNPTTLEVVIVPDSDHRVETETVIKEDILANVSDSFDVVFTHKEQIEREKSGKIRLVKSLI